MPYSRLCVSMVNAADLFVFVPRFIVGSSLLCTELDPENYNHVRPSQAGTQCPMHSDRFR